MKSYFFAHSHACPPEYAHRILNDTAAIETWVSPFPYSAIIVSKLNPHKLAAVLRQRLPNIWLLVTEMNSQDVDGWLPGNLWEFVQNPAQATSQQLLPISA
ncbi:MAG: hypothetical protein OXC62_11255 [Aestuariivita sp.]|nr:hypothetical protein [Aestuariivita sp.]